MRVYCRGLETSGEPTSLLLDIHGQIHFESQYGSVLTLTGRIDEITVKATEITMSNENGRKDGAWNKSFGENMAKLFLSPLTGMPQQRMSIETAFYRRNFVISSVSPWKRAYAGQNYQEENAEWKSEGRASEPSDFVGQKTYGGRPFLYDIILHFRSLRQAQ